MELAWFDTTAGGDRGLFSEIDNLVGTKPSAIPTIKSHQHPYLVDCTWSVTTYRPQRDLLSQVLLACIPTAHDHTVTVVQHSAVAM